LQLTDIHLGEAEGTEWGPVQDRKSWIGMDNMIQTELFSSSENGGGVGTIDLLVLSGDQITGNNCLDNCTTYYRQLADFLTLYDIPWAMIFGNHDDSDYEMKLPNGTIRVIPTRHSRRDLLQVMQEYPLDRSQEGPLELFGISNYVLDIHLPQPQPGESGGADPAESSPIAAAQIYMLDSGGGQLPQQIQQNQIDWFVKQQRESAASLPAVAFQHIPTGEFEYSKGNSDQDSLAVSTLCRGFQGEGIDPLHDGDAGIVQALSDSGQVQVLAVGHNHGNDYCCPFSDNLRLCFGRHSGYGGYSHKDWERGARVYDLTLIHTLHNKRDGNNNLIPDHRASTYSMTWNSWVRLESGAVTSRTSSSE
jgi:hypothetical protein